MIPVTADQGTIALDSLDRGVNHIGWDTIVMATHELLILRTARNYKLILQRLFFIEKPRMKWPLVFLIVLHQTLQITGAILFMIGSKASTHSIMAPATLAGKIHALILPWGYIVFAIWWRQIDYVVKTLQEVNEILLYAQFPLLGSLRAAVITELESRHRTIILCLAYASHVAVSVYFLPSLTALFFNPSQLRLPVEMADPFPLLGIASNDLIRVLIYFGYFASYLLHFYITFTGAAILIVTVDSLKTALAANMKNAIEPLLTIILTVTVAYDVIVGLAFVQYTNLMYTFFVFLESALSKYDKNHNV
ncbi:unnamed protein product [Bemisia tabaci]|uniref:Uncharacterized protein n=1 Tax=Bemisia tabaci TaxID=7038 RepID=A0A9P0A9T4_BEMTA|nr:unnamed protein product [Bemisia tabaci]